MSEESLLGQSGDVAATETVATPEVQTAAAATEPVVSGAPDTAETVAEWKAALEEDLRMDPSMKHINDVGALAKSYVHAQRQLGADKIVVPSKHASEEDWNAVFSKLGKPETLEQYELKPLEGNTTDDEVFSKFKEIAYANNLLPQQAQKVYDWYNSLAGEMVEKQRIENEGLYNEQLQGLKQEWGDGFTDKVQLAQGAVLHVGGEDLKNYMNESGLGNDVTLIKAFAKVAEVLGEDKFQDGRIFTGGYTVEDSKQKVEEVMGDVNNPYFDRKHPGHAAAVKEMSTHFENINRAKPKSGYAVG